MGFTKFLILKDNERIFCLKVEHMKAMNQLLQMRAALAITNTERVHHISLHYFDSDTS